MRMTIAELRSVVGQVIAEAPKKGAKKAPKKAPRKEAPSSLMKRIVDALRTVGFKVTARERNPGSMKAWLSAKDPTIPAGIETISGALRRAKLAVSPGYELTELKGAGFRVEALGEEQGGGVFVAVFTGPRAEEEEEGIDTTDLGF